LQQKMKASKIDKDWLRHSALEVSSTSSSSPEPAAEAVVVDNQEAAQIDGPDDEEKRLLKAILGTVKEPVEPVVGSWESGGMKAPEKGKQKLEPQKQTETDSSYLQKVPNKT
jgi:hypothetical protein